MASRPWMASWGKCYQERNSTANFSCWNNETSCKFIQLQTQQSCFLEKRVSKRPIGTNFVLLAATSEFICLQNILFVMLLSLREHNSVILISGYRNHLNSSCDPLLLDLRPSANQRKQFDNFSTKQTKEDLLSCLCPWLWNVWKVHTDVHLQDVHHGWTISDAEFLNLAYDQEQRKESMLFHYITLLSSISRISICRYVRYLLMWTA